MGNRTTHGASGSPEYVIWTHMKARCFDESDKSYQRYGGRGITVCQRWVNDFPAFYADMGDRPSPLHSIERKNNEGNYEPGNCRWATATEQARNRRSSVLVEHNGQVKTVAEWAEIHGIKPGVLGQRLRREGMDIGRALKAHAWKLTLDQVSDIKQRRANGERRVDLAVEFNVTTQQIYNICSGKQRSEVCPVAHVAPLPSLFEGRPQ